jgi:predicted ester cyclase
MSGPALAELYRSYIDCLNRQDWANLGDFVGEDVVHNDRQVGIEGYREMLERDYAQIPDLRFQIDFLVVEPPHVASRLIFDCRPKGRFLGLDVDGRRVAFAENVIYAFREGLIRRVWSIIDKAAIEEQIGAPSS